jgi:hypothetical protein
MRCYRPVKHNVPNVGPSFSDLAPVNAGSEFLNQRVIEPAHRTDRDRYPFCVGDECMRPLVIWKVLEAKASTLDRGQIGTQNLAHSLAEHASHTN